MLFTSSNDNLALLIRLHHFIQSKRRGSRNEIASQLGVGKNKLTDLIYVLNNSGAEIKYNLQQRHYEYLSPFEFYIGPARKRA